MNVTLSSWVASGSQSWLGISLYLPSISSLWNSSTVCVFGCYSPSLSANSFSTSLIVDAICKSFNWLSYLRFASRARPVALLFSVYSNCNSVENKFRTTDFYFFLLRYLLQLCPCNSVVMSLPIPHSIMLNTHMHMKDNEHCKCCLNFYFFRGDPNHTHDLGFQPRQRHI